MISFMASPPVREMCGCRYKALSIAVHREAECPSEVDIAVADGPNAFESVNGSGSADDEGIKRGVNLGLVAGVQRTRDRFSDIAAYERFAEHLHHPGGLRSFAQLRATVAAH